mgnify:CR=1 FL=1
MQSRGVVGTVGLMIIRFTHNKSYPAHFQAILNFEEFLASILILA